MLQRVKERKTTSSRNSKPSASALDYICVVALLRHKSIAGYAPSLIHKERFRSRAVCHLNSSSVTGFWVWTCPVT